MSKAKAQRAEKLGPRDIAGSRWGQVSSAYTLTLPLGMWVPRSVLSPLMGMPL